MRRNQETKDCNQLARYNSFDGYQELSSFILFQIIFVLSLISLNSFSSEQNYYATFIQISKGSHGLIYQLPEFAKSRRQTYLDFGPGQLKGDEKAMLNYVLDRLEKIDPVTAKRYRLKNDKFDQESLLIEESMMVTPKESYKDRQGRQVESRLFILQNTKPESGQYKYLLNKRLWALVPAYVRVGAKLNQFVASDALEMGHVNSEFFSQYVFKICSSEMRNMTAIKYLQLLSWSFLARKKSQFSVRIQVRNLVDQQGTPINDLAVSNITFVGGATDYDPSDKSSELYFYLRAESFVSPSVSLVVNDHQRIPLTDGDIGFTLVDGKFQVENITLKNDQILKVGSYEIPCSSLFPVEVYKNGILQTCTVAKTFQVQYQDRHYKIFAGSKVFFNQDEYLFSVSIPGKASGYKIPVPVQ